MLQYSLVVSLISAAKETSLNLQLLSDLVNAMAGPRTKVFEHNLKRFVVK